MAKKFNSQIIIGLLGAFAISFQVLAQSTSVQLAPPGTTNFDPRNPPTQTVALAGESLFDIAERTKSPIRGIIDANELLPPYNISAGQVIKLPPLKVHIVQRGETFAQIAARYHVHMRSLAVFNNLRKPYTIHPNQRIILPALVEDSLTGLEPQDLVELLASEINQGRNVSGRAASTIVRQQTQTQTQTQSQTQTPPPKITPKTEPPKTIVPPPKAPPSLPKTPPPTKTENPVPIIAGRFIWPVRGQILETFGEKPGFRKVDGIEIGADENTPIRAAAAGTVAYVGDRLQGYGWLALIRHNNGFITAYAYASEISVQEGQSVTQGQVIGKVGSTGRATSPRLHFQIRSGTTPVDPMRHLPRA